MNLIIQIGKRRSIYIPKSVAEKLDIGEGDKLILEVIDGKIILTPVRKSLSRDYWGKASLEEVEEVGEELTEGIIRRE